MAAKADRCECMCAGASYQALDDTYCEAVPTKAPKHSLAMLKPSSGGQCMLAFGPLQPWAQSSRTQDLPHQLVSCDGWPSVKGLVMLWQGRAGQGSAVQTMAIKP